MSKLGAQADCSTYGAAAAVWTAEACLGSAQGSPDRKPCLPGGRDSKPRRHQGGTVNLPRRREQRPLALRLELLSGEAQQNRRLGRRLEEAPGRHRGARAARTLHQRAAAREGEGASSRRRPALVLDGDFGHADARATPPPRRARRAARPGARPPQSCAVRAARGASGGRTRRTGPRASKRRRCAPAAALRAASGRARRRSRRSTWTHAMGLQPEAHGAAAWGTWGYSLAELPPDIPLRQQLGAVVPRRVVGEVGVDLVRGELELRLRRHLGDRGDLQRTREGHAHTRRKSWKAREGAQAGSSGPGSRQVRQQRAPQASGYTRLVTGPCRPDSTGSGNGSGSGSGSGPTV